MENNFYSLGDVAQRLGTKAYKIHYLLACHRIAEPQLRIGSRRIWTEAELVVIAHTLHGIKNDKKRGNDDG